jgi:phenylacetate-CoA ligase
LEVSATRGADDVAGGELIVTSLVNFAMPFLRYRIGDRACLSAGHTAEYAAYPILERLDGRLHDVLVRLDGSRVMPEFVHRVLREYEEIDRYQVIQHTSTQFSLHLRTRRPIPASRAEEVKRRFLGQLGPVSLSVSYDGRFLTKAGKYRPVISFVA